MEQKMKKFGVNSTLLLTSLSLVACGGGGSEGYYNNEGSNNNTDNSGNESETDTSTVAESLTVSLRDLDGNVIQQAQDATKVQFAVKVLNADKGGIADQNVVLSISDTDSLGVTSAASKVASGTDGIAIFELDIPTIQADSGKVNLTATVDGTTIQQVYTLNIKKASVIVSDYNLSVPQGSVLNLPQGTANLTVQVTDTQGGAKSGQTVQLTLPSEMQGKFVTASGSSMTTDNEGKAVFAITANANLTTEEIASLVNSSQQLSFKLIDENQAEKTEVTSITFKDISTVVNTLEIIKPDEAIVAKGGEQTIKVYAKNSNGDFVANKKVQLRTNSGAYGVSLDSAEKQTNAQGFAEFTLTSNSDYPIALSQQGILLTANYLDGDKQISGNATVQVVTSDDTVDDQELVQRLEIASSYQMNASADSVTVSVKGVNFKGVGAKQGKLTLELNDEATANGVTFDGSATQDFAKSSNGVLTYTLKTNAKTDAAVQALVASGISLTFDVEDSEEADQTIRIEVNDKVVSEDQVRYITIDPIEALDYTQSQELEVTVQAIGTNDDGGLAGQSISLKRVGLTENELKTLRLAPEGSMTQATDENGYATFTFKYTADSSDEQKTLALLNKLSLQAISSNNKVQMEKLNFVEPNETSEITLQSLSIETDGVQSLEVNKTTRFTVVVNAVGSDGLPYSGQLIGLGLNQAPLQNGAVIVGGNLQQSVNGQAKFEIQITPKNVTELNNLISNGLMLSVAGRDTNISATRTVQLTTPPVVLPDLAGLDISYSKTTISTLGGETRVKVVAKDASGNVIANTPLEIALSSLTSSRASLSDEPVTTNSKGEAEFTVTVSEGEYDQSLIKNGITFAVVGTNLNNGDRLQQTGNIAVTVPQDALSPRLSAENKSVRLGATTTVNVAVKDELGVFTSGTPIRLSLNQTAIDVGVTLSSDVVVVTASGNVAVDLKVPLSSELTAQQKSDLLSNGIQVTGSMTNAKGSEVSTNLSFTVEEPVNTNQININPDQATMDVNGDESIVTISLTDSAGQPLANQAVTLSANNAAQLIIAGASGAVNGNDPQTLMTDSNGNAFYSVEIAENANKGLLLASGIELTATHINELGVEARQITRLTTFDGSSSTTIQPARYSLRIISAKPTLNVRNDSSEVTVTLLDENGGGVSDQYVELALDNFNVNGASIEGPSGLTTNELGQATFTVKVDESVRNTSYSATEFATDDLRITATFEEAGYQPVEQVRLVDVVQAVIENPIASIVIGVNSTEVSDTADGVYYNRNMSVSVVDFDGKPLANQEVVMDITPTIYRKGTYSWELVTDALGNEEEDWVINVTATCEADEDGNAVTNSQVTDIPVKVPTFLGNGGSTATYTTDSEGKFDLTLRYPKIYAQWLQVQVGATSSVASLPTRTVYDVGLPPLSEDYSDDGSYGPNLVSPYGTTGVCP